MPLNHRPACAATLIVAASLSGCGGGSEVTGPTPFDAAAANARAVSEAASLAAETVVEPEEPIESPQPATEEVAYQPPFPGRLDMFEPQKRAARARKESNGDSADSVVLMGFATLDEPKVVLAINGIVKPLASGQEASGVTVISIAPPRAVLQRGRSRWTASIE